MDGLLIAEVSDGFVVWPPGEVALVRQETHGRLAVHGADGRLGHHPRPLAQLEKEPLVAFEGMLVNPARARIEQGELVIPGGWRFPVSGELPPSAPPPPRPAEPLPGGVTRAEVVLLKGRDGAAWWRLEDGRERRAGESAAAVARNRRWLVKAGRGTYVAVERLRRIVRRRKEFVLTLEPNHQVTVSWGAQGPLCRGLGLPHLLHLEPRGQGQESLYREGLRDWPVELFRASAEFLKEEFTTPRRLLANLIWQTFRYRAQGKSSDYGKDHRAFWYIPVWPVLQRAGLLPEGYVAALESPVSLQEPLTWLAERTKDPYRLLEVLLPLIVGEYRLCTYRELGFEDPRPDLRQIGNRHPEVVVVAEKSSLSYGVDRLADQFGVSTLTLGGLPSLLSTEFFVRALREKHRGTVRLAAYVDYDPSGWIAAEGFAGQLERYGVGVEDIRFLVRPERFTAEELCLYRRRLRGGTPQRRGKIKAWLERSGGIEGLPFGLHADHLRPVERLVQAFVEEFKWPGAAGNWNP